MNIADKSLIRDRINQLKYEAHRHPEVFDKNSAIIKNLKSWLVGKPKADPIKVMPKAEMVAKLNEMAGINTNEPDTTMIIPDRATADRLWHWLKTGPNIQVQAPEDVKNYIRMKFKTIKPIL